MRLESHRVERLTIGPAKDKIRFCLKSRALSALIDASTTRMKFCLATRLFTMPRIIFCRSAFALAAGDSESMNRIRRGHQAFRACMRVQAFSGLSRMDRDARRDSSRPRGERSGSRDRHQNELVYQLVRCNLANVMAPESIHNSFPQKYRPLGRLPH